MRKEARQGKKKREEKQKCVKQKISKNSTNYALGTVDWVGKSFVSHWYETLDGRWKVR